MKKLLKLAICVALILALLSFIDAWRKKQILSENIIRLHVVGNSDSDYDQQVKLQVKDEIINYLEPIAEQFPTKEEAMIFLRENLNTIQELSNRLLEKMGAKERAKVSLAPQSFGLREYDTFYLPSGVYDALRVEIGKAQGENWWCVAFPSLCLPTTNSGFEDAAVSAGFSESMTYTLSGKSGYKIRFFLLDCIGKIENLFCS